MWMGCICVPQSPAKRKKIVMLGLDGAGKTSILYTLKLNKSVPSVVPTTGLNVETVKLDRELSLALWDVGGRQALRKLWKCYTTSTDGIIFVVDSTDRERWSAAKSELMALLGN